MVHAGYVYSVGYYCVLFMEVAHVRIQWLGYPPTSRLRQYSSPFIGLCTQFPIELNGLHQCIDLQVPEATAGCVMAAQTLSWISDTIRLRISVKVSMRLLLLCYWALHYSNRCRSQQSPNSG